MPFLSASRETKKRRVGIFDSWKTPLGPWMAPLTAWRNPVRLGCLDGGEADGSADDGGADDGDGADKHQ